MKNILLILGILVLIVLGGIFLFRSTPKRGEQPKVNQKEAKPMEEQKGELSLISFTFKDGETIPAKYTCSGENVNPPLTISGVPQEAQSLVLIVDDPDAPMGTWDHWILFNIDPTVTAIEEDAVPAGALQGTTSFGERKYGGPCPPPGPAHRYLFKLYALDTKLNLEAGAGKLQIEEEMAGHILAQTQLMGLYSR